MAVEKRKNPFRPRTRTNRQPETGPRVEARTVRPRPTVNDDALAVLRATGGWGGLAALGGRHRLDGDSALDWMLG